MWGILGTICRRLCLCAPCVLLAACGGGGASQFRSAYDEAELDAAIHEVESGEELVAGIVQRFQPHEELWLKADVVIRDLAAREKDFFTAKAMYRAPGHLRMSGSRTPIGTIFDLLVIEEESWLTFPREGQQFAGSTVELTERLGTIGGLGPEQLVAAVLVHQDLRRWIEGGIPYVIERKGKQHYLVAAREPDSGRQFFWVIRGADGLVEEVLVRSPQGAEELQVRYHEYRMEEVSTGLSEPMPCEFTIHVPAQNVSVEVDAGEYKWALPGSAFQQLKAREVYPLGSLRFEERQ